MSAEKNDAPALSPMVPSVAPAQERVVASAPARTPGGVHLDSAALFQGNKAVTIRHNGELYRLQATRQGKLILTK